MDLEKTRHMVSIHCCVTSLPSRNVFTTSLLSNRRPIVPRVCFCGNVFNTPLPTNRCTCNNVPQYIDPLLGLAQYWPNYILILIRLIYRATVITSSGNIQCRMASVQHNGNILFFIKSSIIWTLNSSNNLHCHRMWFIVSLASPHSHFSVLMILNWIKHSFRQ
jgi:hypothetical protein